MVNIGYSIIMGCVIATTLSFLLVMEILPNTFTDKKDFVLPFRIFLNNRTFTSKSKSHMKHLVNTETYS